MPQEFYENMWRVISVEKKPFVGEVHNVRKDGSEYWQELHIAPILDERGGVKFFIGIESNITERKKKEEFREEFISVLGHQGMTPLTSIRWWLELLLRSGGLTREQREILEEVYQQDVGLINLFGDLLFLSRMGGGYPQKEQFDLAEMIGGIVKNAEERHPGVSFAFTRGEESFFLLATKSLVSQVFTNIILNAGEYSDKEKGKVTVTLARGAQEYAFSCQDNGIGIPEEDQSHIFSRFFRGSNAHTVKETGSGLGLFIVKMIADAHGWEVSFKSTVEVGTTFFVNIPVKPQKAVGA